MNLSYPPPEKLVSIIGFDFNLLLNIKLTQHFVCYGYGCHSTKHNKYSIIIIYNGADSLH